MPGPILHQGATVACMHAAPALPTVPNLRVRVAGQPVTTASAPWTVTGCPFVPPGGNGPCVTAQFITFATRVRAGGVPVLLLDSQAVCAPTGTGVLIILTQLRVRAQ
ncbi:MAG: hypothetical protein ACRENP_05095 [Longimicrobiales bacterium]